MRKMLAVLVSVIILISCSFQPSTQEKLGAKESTSSPRELQMVASQTPDQIGAASESVKEPEKPANNLKVDSLELILTVPSKGYLVGNQYAYMLGGNIQVSNLTTGASDWVTNVGDGWLMHADEQNLYVKQADQRIDAYDVQTGEFRWKVLLPGPYLAIVNYRDEHLVYIISVDLSTGQVTMLIVDKVSGEVLQTVDDFVPSINDFSSLVGYQDLMIFRSRGQLGKELFAWSPVKQTSVYHILEDSSINCGTVNIIAASSSSRETQYGGYDALNGSLLWSREFPETLKKNLHCGSKLETNPASMWLVGGALWYEPQIYSESPLPFFFTQQREDLTAVDLKSGEIL
jgi:outer membrane protein assembly factor BamB